MLTTLAERGRPASTLARMLGINSRIISAIRDGRHRRISIAIHQRVRAAYAELRRADPVSRDVREGRAARAQAWAARRRSL